MILRRSSRDGRRAATRPPTSDPSEKPASATPASARLPCASAKAGIAISADPNPSPMQSERSASVLTPTEDSAPSREVWRSSAGSESRTGGSRMNANVPIAAITAAPATAAAGSNVARTATSSGPPTKITSWSAASSAYAVLAPSSPATVGQIDRITDEIGASVRPAAAANTAITGDRRLDRAEDGGDPEERRVENEPSSQDARRPATVDLAPAVRRPHGDRHGVGGGDETGLAVACARRAHEQHERERAHPVRDPRHDAPREERCGIAIGEELAVPGNASRFVAVRHPQEGSSTADGAGPGGSRIFWRR